MNVAIVGGGITGLTLARELSSRGHRPTVFERGKLGGLARSFRVPGTQTLLECFYHHIFKSDHDIIALIEELGLQSELLWLPSRTGLFAQGKAWSFGKPLDLIRFRPCGSPFQRILMGINMLYFSRTSDYAPLDQVSCREFFRRRHNLKGYEGLWEPLLKQKFADAHERTPAAFLWGRIYPRAHSREKGSEHLGYLRGSFQVLVDKMVGELRNRGVSVFEGTRVSAVRPGLRPEIVTDRGSQTFDRVIWTAPTETLPLHLDGVAEGDRKILSLHESMAVTCLVLGVDGKKGDFYWVNNTDPEVQFGVGIEHTNLVPPQEYQGTHILYFANYHRGNDPRFASVGSRELFKRYVPSIRLLLPEFREENVRFCLRFRDAFSSPLYEINHLRKMPPFSGWFEGLDICNMSQVYPQDRNMNNCIANAKRYVTDVTLGS